MLSRRESKMTLTEKKDKVGFILSSRYARGEFHESMYKDLFNTYLNMDDDEVNIEFDFYYNH